MSVQQAFRRPEQEPSPANQPVLDRAPRGRPRLGAFGFERLANGRCRATVTLTWAGEAPVVGEFQGMTSPSGDLRCAAQACLNAIAQVVRVPAFDLLGVKAVRAFDATVIIVSLAIRGNEGGPRLVGSCLAGDDVVRGAAVAVLHATNRIITKRSAS